jgi:outer membrane protein insertion porin family
MRVSVLVPMIVWLAVASPAPAQPAAAAGMGRSVVAQSVTIDGRPVAEPGLLDLVATAPGHPLTPMAVRQTIAHFIGLGRFEDVVVSAEERPDGVALTYALVPARLVRSLVFHGDTAVSAAQLNRRVADRLGFPLRMSRVPEVPAVLEAAYRDEGFLRARVTPRPELRDAGADSLVIDVEAGPRVRLGRIAVEGNAPGGLGGMPVRLGLRTGQPYRKSEVDAKLAKLVSELRGDGYYEARADHHLTPAPDGLTTDLVVSVDGGARISVVFEGDTLTPKERRELVPIEREGSVDTDLLEDSANRIRERLRAQGYREADADFVRAPRENELAVVFTIRRGPQFRTAHVTIEAAAAMTDAELRPLLRTRPGEPFVETTIEGDAAAIAEQYRRRGFTQVKVTPTPVPVAGGGVPVPIDVRFTIVEGPRTLLGTIDIVGEQAVDEASLRKAIASRTGQPFYNPQVAIDRDGILLVFLNRGYPAAAVDYRVTFSPDRARANLQFLVSEGSQVFVDHVLVVGNVKTSAETIRREVTLKAGAPLSYADLTESQRRISALGLFRRVRITELDHGEANRRDLLVTVEEAPATTFGYGGGIEGGQRLRRSEPGGPATEVFEVAPRGVIEYGRRNLFGRNQSVNLFGRASLRTRASTTDVVAGEPQPSGYTLRDYRALGSFRSPRVGGTANDLLLTAFLEQGLRSSFNFTRRGARVELGRHLSPKVSFSGRYVIERTRLFEERFDPADKPLIDRLFPQVRLSTMSAAFIRDTRDDLLAPTRGALVGWDSDIAAQAIGSEVGFLKTFAQGYLYRRLPGRRPVVFAAGARLGLANGFDRTVPQVDDDGNPVIGPDGQQIVDVVSDLPASERFFAGGDTSVRGYALDRLGTPETIDRNGFPKGGNAVFIMNAELRVPVWGGLGAVGFMDAGNVFNRIDNFSFTAIKPTAGFGVRYQSPIGPIRVDLGFKLDRGRLPTGELERQSELHISLGQAF